MLTEFKGPALIEEFLDSPEYNVTVWGCATREANSIAVLGISTMTYDAFDDIHDRLCTFEAKWDPASAAYQHIPASAGAGVARTPGRDRARVSRCVPRRRLPRLRARGSAPARQQPMALDVNANCDLSPDSGFANAGRATGLSYADMLEQLVLFALQRRDNALARSDARYATEGRVPLPVARWPGDFGEQDGFGSHPVGRRPRGNRLAHRSIHAGGPARHLRHPAELGHLRQADAECVDQMFGEAIARPGDDNYRFISCWEDQQLAGFACYGRESLTQGTWDLFWICVSGAARRKGAGRALLAEVQHRAAHERVRLMVIYTSSTDKYAPARRHVRSVRLHAHGSGSGLLRGWR